MKQLDDLLHLPYKIELVPEAGGGGFHASIPALQGCMAFGETVQEALDALQEAKQVWLELAIERGWDIPELKPEEKEYSGRFNVRVPRHLHRELVELADQQGTSLNQLVVTLLAEGVGGLRQGRRDDKLTCQIARVNDALDK